jgi:hypothetical protein
MSPQPFDAPHLKIRRARKHIGDLTTEIQAYLGRVPFWLEIQQDAAFANGRKWRAHVREQIPLDFAAIIGDVIHNLRTALDLTAGELAMRRGESADDVYFPVTSKPSEFYDLITDKNFHRAGSNAIALLRTYEPYRGVNNPLRAIHDLDVMDRHQMLLPIADMLRAPDEKDRGKILRRVAMGPIKEGAEFAVNGDHLLLPIGHKNKENLFLSFPILTSNSTKAPLSGLEVAPALIMCADHVESIVKAFAALH